MTSEIQTIDNLEEEVSNLNDTVVELTYDLDQSEGYGADLASAVYQAISDLVLLSEVPLKDLESSIAVIVESLRVVV